MKKHINFVFLLVFILAGSACYHSTGIEAPVSVVSRTDENNAKLYISDSPKTMGAYDDFYLSNNRFDVIVDGGILGERKQNFLAPTGGTIVDITNIAVDALGNKESYNNDNINQIFQVVNNNLNTPVAYTNIKVDTISDESASLVCEGYVMDKSGEFANAGFAVDPQTRLVKDLKVTTVYYIERNSTYLKMTTVVENTSDRQAPIFTIGDFVFTGGNTSRRFVPAPGYGYAPENASHGIVYAPFVAFEQHVQPFQALIEFSPDDGVVMCQFDSSNQAYEKSGGTYTVVSKVGKTTDVVSPHGSITFERYIIPALSANMYTAFFNALNIFEDASSNPLNFMVDLARISGYVNYNLDQQNMIVQFEQIIPGKYFDGNEIVNSPIPVPMLAYRTSNTGGFSVYLPAGTYQLRVSGNGIKDYVENTYTFFDAGDPDVEGDETEEERQIIVEPGSKLDVGEISLYPDLIGRVETIVKDSNGTIIPARVSIFPLDPSKTINFGEQEEVENGSLNYYFLYYGDRKIPLMLGDYDFVISAGPLYSISVNQVGISKGEDEDGNPVVNISPESLEVSLTKVVDNGNYIPFDPAVLTNFSYNCTVNGIERTMEALSEHVKIIMTADINTVADLLDYHAALKSRYKKETTNSVDFSDDDIRVLTGATIKSFSPKAAYPEGFGEFLVFPVKRVEGLKGYGIGETGDREFATVFDTLKTKMQLDNLYAGLINPRDNSALPNGVKRGLFEALNSPVPINPDNSYFSRVSEHGTGTTNNVFSLIEVLENVKYSDYLKNRLDWFNLLNSGEKKLAFGASNWPGATPYFTGNPRTYVYYEMPDGQSFNEDDFLAQFATGHSFVSTGPFLDVKVNSAMPGDTVSVSSNSVDVSINIKAPDWIPVDEVRIIVNGEVVFREPVPQSDNVNRYSKTVNVALPSTDSYIVVECGATLENIASGIYPQGDFARIYPGVQPLAFTNPIFVDRDGDSMWHGK
ncbi:hypothetical protein TTHT_1875 [Thermotomaculum hydrothermale]|uniref:Uncharacterized protein n=1 Tax=Thermotomaculum hydrothermale TaxID=981385 RepID=A0A7R6SZ70_9BACT|nr:CehA/McbA family metallohydrolase [Thermotomaculum hydrothermale]BBB33331.1 hypothetical protein TTHT_1875 [Thermotomaculum hydrothermale]